MSKSFKKARILSSDNDSSIKVKQRQDTNIDLSIQPPTVNFPHCGMAELASMPRPNGLIPSTFRLMEDIQQTPPETMSREYLESELAHPGLWMPRTYASRPTDGRSKPTSEPITVKPLPSHAGTADNYVNERDKQIDDMTMEPFNATARNTIVKDAIKDGVESVNDDAVKHVVKRDDTYVDERPKQPVKTVTMDEDFMAFGLPTFRQNYTDRYTTVKRSVHNDKTVNRSPVKLGDIFNKIGDAVNGTVGDIVENVIDGVVEKIGTNIDVKIDENIEETIDKKIDEKVDDALNDVVPNNVTEKIEETVTHVMEETVNDIKEKIHETMQQLDDERLDIIQPICECAKNAEQIAKELAKEKELLKQRVQLKKLDNRIDILNKLIEIHTNKQSMSIPLTCRYTDVIDLVKLYTNADKVEILTKNNKRKNNAMDVDAITVYIGRKSYDFRFEYPDSYADIIRHNIDLKRVIV